MASLTNKIGSGIFYTSVSNFVVKIIGALSYILVISRLTLHDYGVFVFLVSLTTPFSALVFFGFDRIFVSKYAQARSEGKIGYIKGLFKDYYLLSILITLFSIFIAYLLKNYLSEHYNLYIDRFFWVTAVFAVSQILMNYVSLILEANQNFKEISVIQTIESISRLVFIIAISFTVGLSIPLVLVIYAISKLSATVVGLFYLRPIFHFLRQEYAPAQVGVLHSLFISIGKWEVARDIIEKILQPLKLFLIKFFVSIEGVAVFDFARNIYAFASSLFPVSKVIFPIISHTHGDKEKTHLIISKAQKYAFLFQSGIFVAALFLTVPVLKYLFPQYVGTELIIYIVLLHFITDVYKIGQTALLYALDRQKFTFFVTPILIFFQIILDVVFLKFFGLIGIAFAWHLEAFISGLVYNLYIKHTVGIKRIFWKDFIKFDSYDRIILNKTITKIKNLAYFR